MSESVPFETRFIFKGLSRVALFAVVSLLFHAQNAEARANSLLLSGKLPHGFVQVSAERSKRTVEKIKSDIRHMITIGNLKDFKLSDYFGVTDSVGQIELSNYISKELGSRTELLRSEYAGTMDRLSIFTKLAWYWVNHRSEISEEEFGFLMDNIFSAAYKSLYLKDFVEFVDAFYSIFEIKEKDKKSTVKNIIRFYLSAIVYDSDSLGSYMFLHNYAGKELLALLSPESFATLSFKADKHKAQIVAVSNSSSALGLRMLNKDQDPFSSIDYLDKIKKEDVFLFLDFMQMPKADAVFWRKFESMLDSDLKGDKKLSDFIINSAYELSEEFNGANPIAVADAYRILSFNYAQEREMAGKTEITEKEYGDVIKKTVELFDKLKNIKLGDASMYLIQNNERYGSDLRFGNKNFVFALKKKFGRVFMLRSDNNEYRKKKYLDWLAEKSNQKYDFFYFSGHGYKNSFSISDNESISADDIADALKKRFENYGSSVMEKTIIVFDACFQTDMIYKITSKLSELKTPSPIMITGIPENQYGISYFDSENYSRFKDAFVKSDSLRDLIVFSYTHPEYRINPTVVLPDSYILNGALRKQNKKMDKLHPFSWRVSFNQKDNDKENA